MKHIHKLIMTVVLTAGILAVLAVPTVRGDSPPLQPGNDQGLFVVEDVEAQFNALKHHGEALGWRLPEANGAPDPSYDDHYQGIVRHPGVGISPIFYVTQRDDDDNNSSGGYLHVVRLGTRAMDGERLRSNLQSLGQDTAFTMPKSSDTWLGKIRFDGSLLIDDQPLPAYEHPGGMAIVDGVLFMAIDAPVSNGTPGHIILFDLRPNPVTPKAIQALPLSHRIDNLAVTRQDDGTYLIWINGDGGTVTKFYKTNGTDLRADTLSISLVQNWNPNSSADYEGPGWPGPGSSNGHEAHQSSTFIRQTDGSLYLIGMSHDHPVFTGDDYADLYEVQPKLLGNGFKLIHRQRGHFYCEFRLSAAENGTSICNFAAANNAYVSPSGELMLYSIPHDDEDDWAIDFVRLAEFRHQDVNRENSPLRLPTAHFSGPYVVNESSTVTLSGYAFPATDRPWVELYDDDSWKDRSIVVDYDDRALLELNNFNNLDGFNDKTTSIRWRLPVGLDVELFDDDNFQDRRIILRGTGQTESIANLNNQVVVPGLVEHPGKNAGESLDFNDKTSSMRFIGSLPNNQPTLLWDLDGDGIFGEGISGSRGFETGLTPKFHADGLDGPSEYTVAFRASSPDGVYEDSAIIFIANVSPTKPEIGTDITLEEGASTVLNASGSSDPGGNGDPLTYEWDFNYNGIQFDVDATGLAPTFSAAGLDGPISVTIALRAKDNDGGKSPVDTAVVTVLNVAPTTPYAGDDIALDEGSTVILNGTGSSDPAGAADLLTYEWDLDYDGVTFEVDATSLNPGFTGLDGPAAFTVALRAVDDDGGISDVDTAAIQVNNVLPTVNAGDDLVIAEGTTIVIEGTASDPADDADSLNYEWDLDYDGVTFNVDATGPTPNFTGLDGPISFTVALRVSDDDAGDADLPIDTALIEVTNVAPAAQLDSVNGGLENIGLVTVPVNLSGSFSDVPADTHTAVVDWGNGETGPALVDQTAGAVAATYTYSETGVWDVVLTLTDDDGASVNVLRAITVYDGPGAISAVIQQIDVMLPFSTPDTQLFLQGAREKLAGQDGALAELQNDNPVAALQKIASAIAELKQAGTGLSSTDSLMRLLTLVARSTAQIALDDAVAAIGTRPTPEQEQALAQIELLMADGIASLAASDYEVAVQTFEMATVQALALLP